LFKNLAIHAASDTLYLQFIENFNRVLVVLKWVSYMIRKNIREVDLPTSLPLDGLSRWSAIEAYVPFSREKFRQLVKKGMAPQPVKFSERCTAYSNRELHKFFADPLNYRAEVSK